MNTILTAIVDWKNQSLHVNGVPIILDTLGGGEIDVTKILAMRETYGVGELIAQLEEHYTVEQIKALCTLWGQSRVIMIADTANVMKLSREQAKTVLNIGIQCRVLCRYHNSTWKVVSKDIQTSLLNTMESMTTTTKQKKSATSILHEQIIAPYSDEEINDVEEKSTDSVELKVESKKQEAALPSRPAKRSLSSFVVPPQPAPVPKKRATKKS